MIIDYTRFVHRDKILLDVLAQFCQQKPPKRYLEIGVWKGESLYTVIRNSNPPPKEVIVIDSWRDQFGKDDPIENFDHIEKMLKDINYKGNCGCLQEDSHVILPKLIEHKEKFDLILVDGDHTYNGAWQDLVDAWQLLSVNGHLFFDDIAHDDLPYLKYCFKEFVKMQEDSYTVFYNDQMKQGVGVMVKMDMGIKNDEK